MWGCDLFCGRRCYQQWPDIKKLGFLFNTYTRNTQRENATALFHNWWQPENITQILHLILGQSQDEERNRFCFWEQTDCKYTNSLKIQWNVWISFTKYLAPPCKQLCVSFFPEAVTLLEAAAIKPNTNKRICSDQKCMYYISIKHFRYYLVMCCEIHDLCWSLCISVALHL